MNLGDFIERWICCGRVDDASVVDDVCMVRANPDTMAEQYIDYNHDPEERHITHQPTALVITNNGDNVEELWDDSVVIMNEEKASVVDNMVLTTPKLDEQNIAEFQKFPLETSPISSSDDEASYGIPVVPEGPSSVYRICQDVVEVKRHRRLPHQHRGDYVASVVSDIKNRLGCPNPTEANKLAVRRMANNICNQHGVRPSHMRVVVEVIIAGVFVPDDADLRSAKILASVSVEGLRTEINNAGPTNAWYDLFHPFKNRGASRVHGNV